MTRVAVLEPVLAVVVAVAAGVASGLVGAQITLPAIPLLVAEPSGFTLDLSSAWPARSRRRGRRPGRPARPGVGGRSVDSTPGGLQRIREVT